MSGNFSSTWLGWLWTPRHGRLVAGFLSRRSRATSKGHVSDAALQRFPHELVHVFEEIGNIPVFDYDCREVPKTYESYLIGVDQDVDVRLEPGREFLIELGAAKPRPWGGGFSLGMSEAPKLCYSLTVAIEEKLCRYCGKSYPLDYFGVALSTPQKIYRRRKCRNCYRNTKQALIDRHYEWIAAFKRERGCARCKVNDPRVLDFHHRNKKDKLFGVAALRREVGFKKLVDEIEKCIVLCANCHRITHDEIGDTGRRNNGA